MQQEIEIVKSTGAAIMKGNVCREEIRQSRKSSKIYDFSFFKQLENNSKNILVMKATIKNDLWGFTLYLSITVLLGIDIAFLALFIKENSDRCHYYNGKWNKKDLIFGTLAITIGTIINHFL